MKSLPTKALRDGLARNQSAQAAQADGPHPDAGLLSAYAEDALLERERADVLAHLAACPGCRAVLHTAAAAAAPEEAEILHPQPTRSPLRLWIPGFTLAAAFLVMAASTVLFYRATRTDVPRVQTAASTAPAQTAPAIPAPEPALVTTAIPGPPTPAKVPQHPRRAARQQPPVVAPVLEAREADFAPPPPAPAAPAAGIGGALSGVNVREPSSQNAPLAANERQLQAQTQSQASAYHGTIAAKAAPRAASPAAQTESPTAFVGSPHSMGVIAGLMTNPTAHLRFRISDSGQLERSTQPGVWQPVPSAPPARFRVVSISGADIWAGGDHLRLFHSADNGLTWIEVQLPISADRAQAVAHIRLDSPQRLIVESDTGATWTTTDAGATWQ